MSFWMDKHHWEFAIADTIHVSGCSCIWCRRNNQSNGDSKVERGQPSRYPHPHICQRTVSMATTSSVLEVLYPPSYLNTPPALDPEASPPAYELPPTAPPNTPQVQPPPISSRDGRDLIPFAPHQPLLTPDGVPTPSTEPVPSYHFDTSLDIAVPSAQSPRHRQTTRVARKPMIGLGLQFPTEADSVEPPAYSRFDSSRPRFPAAFDTLGPYPHISILSLNMR
ncbi:hypothetical protein BDR04DRAFT_4602 [Suillus decipiens]|nr:hypothetical protein BDR04DRAFT_4602 [Suillus decipiens]